MPNLGPIVCMKQGWIYSLFSLFFCLLLLEEGVSGYDYDLKIGTEKTVCYEETGAMGIHTISGILQGMHINGAESGEQYDSSPSFFRNGIVANTGRQTKKSFATQFLLYLSIRGRQRGYLLFLQKLII